MRRRTVPRERYHGVGKATHTGARFLFYTNECVGLGHLRRALTLAEAVGRLDDSVSSLIVTGSAVATAYQLPPRVDVVKLPVLGKGENGAGYRPRFLPAEHSGVQELRARLALGVAEAFAPTVAVVDKAPVGLDGDLRPALEYLRASGCHTVLGLRDIDDEPSRVKSKWGSACMRDALERYYDAVLVYGIEGTPHAIDAMGWTDLHIPLHHVGYVGRPPAKTPPPDLPPGYVLVTVGGGFDGVSILESFLHAVRLRPLPCHSVVITGPLMPDEDSDRLRRLAAGLDVYITDFRDDMDSVIAGARAAVSMAGYNTVTELLSANKPGLLIPRSWPSREQLTRATLLASTGAVDILPLEHLAPESMRVALDDLLARSARPSGHRAFQGAQQAARLLAAMAGIDAPGQAHPGHPAASGVGHLGRGVLREATAR